MPLSGLVIFLRSLCWEALGLGANFANTARAILLDTEHLFSEHSQSHVAMYLENSSAPNGPTEGLLQACEHLSRGLERSVSSLVTNPVKTYFRDGGSAKEAANVAFKAIPLAVLTPVSSAAGALESILLGVRNGYYLRGRKT